ncbi:hypothetical protein Q4530_07930 [Colwellia sp. 1_MG-2023]|uniref:hypothetical protein n=1 Tax=unclassified Colwellia TaxID=196834 RepID=UPI001C09F9E7|nr:MULTISPECIES: hypothetical protein [unclassified Colwellia]MBU2926322.1 hypothetical protein [Colwellia sp. C2M11]MDO6651760.1 hypothetical protein [Colwellia sp. 3_MG-2023]MDO6665329.1 hypothetical protein [Colwellia sp. 2_MG-2023]MDO6689702.1 hypothetical protein [Colwellia sp. 1_MG-2023]
MINNVLNSSSSLVTSVAQPINDIAHTLTDELKNIAPEIAQELLSQFDQEKVETLLKKEFASILTLTSQPVTVNYDISPEELAMRTVLTSQQEGLDKNENSEELMKRLNKSVKNIHGAYANTSDILSRLGQLGHEQKSFLASSEQRVERMLDPLMESSYREINEGDDSNRFELSVKTKEGDIVNIIFNSAQGYDEDTGEAVDSFGISYEVEGDLSEVEHQALNQILLEVGEMADEFFKVSANSFGQSSYTKYVPPGQAEFNLDFLANFNNEQLSGFDIAFSTTENQPIAALENSFELSYNFDEKHNTQALSFKSNAGVTEIDFSLDMSIFGGKDVDQMQQYLSTLDQNLEDSRFNSNDSKENSAFGKQNDARMQQGFAVFKDAFTSMSSAAERYSNIESVAAREFTNGREMVADLVDNMVTNDPRYKGLGEETNNTLGTGISKLADFNAKFSFTSEPEGLRPIHPKSTVELSQVTEHYKSGELNGTTQSKTVNAHFDYQGTRPDNYDKTESYNINTAVKKQELVGLDQEHQVDIDKETYEFNPKTNQYELETALLERITNESSIRQINDIWLEKNETSHDKKETERVDYTGKPEDYERTSHHSHDKLVTLIGDLDKLANNKQVKRDYMIDLNNVNFFMDNKPAT